MPIEFECRHCRQTIRVPDGSEGKRTRCFQCETVQPIPSDGLVIAESPAIAEGTTAKRPENPFRDQAVDQRYENPYESPQLDQPRTEAQLRLAAAERLRLPVIICQVFLWLMLLVSLVWAIFFVYVIMEAGEMTEQEGWIVSILVAGAFGLNFFLIVVALMGLGQAQKVGSLVWAWTGFILVAFIGLNCIFILPFAIWGMVVLGDAQVSQAFRTSAKKT